MKTIDIKSAIALAREIAFEAHEGQFRRDGVTPYVTHPEEVANRVDDDAKPVAWLHDVLEDCPAWSEGRLLRCGVPLYVINAVVAITKVEGEDYAKYIQRVKKDRIARAVKIADISHNMDANPMSRAKEKYILALKELEFQEWEQH